MSSWTSGIPLNDWGAIGVESLQVEDFAYAATYSLARRIADRTDLAGLRTVWQAADGAEMAYQPIHADGPAAHGVEFDLAGWQQLLDLLEERTGESYSDLWQDWVVNDDQQRQLAARQSARHAYAAAVAAAEDWELPESIRAEMGAWQFDDAREALDDANDVLRDRDRIEDAAADLELTPPDTLRAAFEGEAACRPRPMRPTPKPMRWPPWRRPPLSWTASPGWWRRSACWAPIRTRSWPRRATRSSRVTWTQAGEAATRAAAARDGADDAGARAGPGRRRHHPAAGRAVPGPAVRAERSAGDMHRQAAPLS